MIRAFVGLPLPEAYQEQGAALRKTLGPGMRSKLSWVRKGNWHLTLKFLGDSTTEQLERLVAELDAITPEAFPFQAGGAGVFPVPKGTRTIRPRVLWIGIRQGEKQVRSLAAAVESAATAAGYAPEERDFSPHLTLARVKYAEADPWENVLSTLQSTAWPQCTLDRFVLWKSVLGPGGPVYTALREFTARA